jgi:hypothetical protein
MVETKRYTMAELYELHRVIIRHCRTIPAGPARNDHRQIASSMRSLSRDKDWLAIYTVDGLEWGRRAAWWPGDAPDDSARHPLT